MTSIRHPGHRTPAALLALAVAATLAGCSSGAPAGTREARERWDEQGSETYSFVLESSCGERALYGRFAVQVVDGDVAEVTGLDESGRASTQLPTLAEYTPTVAGLLERIATDGKSVTDVEFDPVTGMPTRVSFDPIPNAIDDEECYELSGLDLDDRGSATSG